MEYNQAEFKKHLLTAVIKSTALIGILIYQYKTDFSLMKKLKEKILK